MRVWLVAAFAGLCAASTAGDVSSKPVKARFAVDGQNYAATLPDGFCLPDEVTRGQAETLAAVDPWSLTDLVFFSCAETAATGDPVHYGMIKTPKRSLGRKVSPRAELLAELKSEIRDGSLAEDFRRLDLTGDADKAIKDQIGVELKLSGQPQFVAVDDKAGYLLDVAGAEVGGKRARMTFVAAITVVRGRILTWGEYAPYTSNADLAALLRRVKVEIAKFIADNGG